MIHEMIREDILRVYVGSAVLTPTEQEEVISQVRLQGAAFPSL